MHFVPFKFLSIVVYWLVESLRVILLIVPHLCLRAFSVSLVVVYTDTFHLSLGACMHILLLLCYYHTCFLLS